jgi:hypothetical protein
MTDVPENSPWHEVHMKKIAFCVGVVCWMGCGTQPDRNVVVDTTNPSIPAEPALPNDDADDADDEDGDGDVTPPPPPPDNDVTPPPPPDVTPPPENACPRVRVNDIAPDDLLVRATPDRAQDPIAFLASGFVVEVVSSTVGEDINGNVNWFEVVLQDRSGFVSAAFVSCTTDAASTFPTRAAGFVLPFACDTSVTVTQGNHSGFSHNGESAFAFDFGVELDTPLHAMDGGVISWARSDVDPGDACYNGGDSSCENTVNYVQIEHSDGTTTLYLHLNESLVSVGELVSAGDVIALSGGTGWSTGPHTHVQRQENCGSWWCPSMEMVFADAGVPNSGDVVTSGNCP